MNLVQHTFTNYSAQRNWAMEHVPLKYDWELHLDADERVSERLAADLSALKRERSAELLINGYCMPRLVQFMGRPIKHGGMFPDLAHAPVPARQRSL